MTMEVGRLPRTQATQNPQDPGPRTPRPQATQATQDPGYPGYPGFTVTMEMGRVNWTDTTTPNFQHEDKSLTPPWSAGVATHTHTHITRLQKSCFSCLSMPLLYVQATQDPGYPGPRLPRPQDSKDPGPQGYPPRTQDPGYPPRTQDPGYPPRTQATRYPSYPGPQATQDSKDPSYPRLPWLPRLHCDHGGGKG